MNTRIINDIKKISENEWENFVVNHPNASIFQSLGMYKYFSSLDNYEPIVLASVDENEKINGILMATIMKESGYLGVFSARCIINGGPIVSDLANSSQVVDTLLKELNSRVGSKSIYTEFRNYYDMSVYKEVFEKNGYEYNEHLNFLVKTISQEEVKKNLSKSKKRQIDKSLKEGAEIVSATNVDDVKEFYSLLKELYDTKVKKPLPDFTFFEKFYHNKELGVFLLVKYNGKVVGGIMCPVYAGKIYEWYIGGKDEEYKNINPSVLATWAPIDYALKNGLKCFDFMGAGKPDADYGVREFKSKFGGDLVNYGRFFRNNKPLLYKIGETGLKLKQKIK